MSGDKNLSNPFSTGGGGVHFEAHVQASFVTLMLTRGYTPCLPCWPIAEIKLQGKVAGFETDDFIAFVENPVSKERRKLLGQIKHSIGITKGSTLFGEVAQAAWDDFNNAMLFTKSKDIIALITGPLSKTDTHNVQWLLNQARHTASVDEFFTRIYKAKFSPAKSIEKLDAIKHHLKVANGNNDISKEILYDFLRHFYLLGYDFGNEFGVALSLLHSHISQFHQQYPQWVWSRVVDIVQTWNKDAGTITPDNLPEDLLKAFEQPNVAKIPEKFKGAREIPKTDWTQHSDATYLALATLIGSWNEQYQCDVDVVTELLGISYNEWLNKARKILQHPDSPLSLKNGIWKVLNRAEFWNLQGSHILDHNLDTFESLAISTLTEMNPAFELSQEERYTANIHGKVLKCSQVLREGIAEGLAIMGTRPNACSNCSQKKAETTCLLVLRALLQDADWILWGSLNNVLPTLAESAPSEFLNSVEKALQLMPCPFDELFAQEGSGLVGSNYLTGLLWALEDLAWDEQYLVRVCVLLGELASRDPGGQWANRPFNSLITILLPWFPQTLASVEKRFVAVQTLLSEFPDVTWDLMIQLLSNQHTVSVGSHKPSWRQTIPNDFGNNVTFQEYRQQVSFYADRAVAVAGHNAHRLSVLIDHFDHLPESAFNQLIELLASPSISKLPEEQRLSIWNHLTKFTHEHRRFSDAKWALSDELVTRIEHVAEQLAPTNPFNLYQNLFTEHDSDLYDENHNLSQQQTKLENRREEAVSKILQNDGIQGVVRFSEFVASPWQVGYALGTVEDEVIEQTLLPHFLDTTNNKHKILTSGLIWRRYYINGWTWSDNIDKSSWTPVQIGKFLSYLPFMQGTWYRASEWLQENEYEYWTRTSANAYQADGDLSTAIEKLIQYDRPHAAIKCLDRMLHAKQEIETNQCVQALLAALSSSEPTNLLVTRSIIELIKFLQTEPSVNQDDLFKLEWAYISLLKRHEGTEPRLLERRLANNPHFFCEVIRLIYRSKNEATPKTETTEKSKTIASNAWQLLHDWKRPPGTQANEMFSEEDFTEWLESVQRLSAESGHLEVALTHVGQVLIHAPPDPGGLWIHHAVATALNKRENDEMRTGFGIGIYNSRGAHWVDPTGKPERELAEQFRSKAEEVENAGFYRFAVTLRGLANDYDREAEQIIKNHAE